MKKSIKKNFLVLATVTLGGVVLASATSQARPDRKGPPRHPPQEAIDACAESEAGDTCEFTHRDRTIRGKCRLPPSRDDRPQRNAEGEEEEPPLACVPDRRPPRRDNEAEGSCTGESGN